MNNPYIVGCNLSSGKQPIFVMYNPFSFGAVNTERGTLDFSGILEISGVPILLSNFEPLEAIFKEQGYYYGGFINWGNDAICLFKVL